MGVTVRLVDVRVGGIATLRSTVAVQGTHGIDDAMRSKRNGMGILANALEPHHIFRLVAVDLISHCSTREVVFVVADSCALVAIRVEVVGSLAIAITPHRVGAIHADDETGIVAVGNHTTIVANPTAEGCSLATTADTTSVKAIEQLNATGTTHAHATDTSSILLTGTDASLVTAVLEGDRAASVGSTGNTTDKAQAGNRRAIVDNHILDVSTIV